MTAPLTLEEMRRQIYANPTSGLPQNPPSAPVAAMPIVQAPSAPSSYIEDDVEGERNTAAYLGGFAELFAKTLYKPYQELLNDPAGYFTRERITEEDFEAMRQKARAFWERPASYAIDLITDPMDTVAGTATSVGQGVAGAFGQAVDYLRETSAGDMARDTGGLIPMVVAGGLKMFVEPMLTTFTQEVVDEGGGTRPATAEELAGGVFGTIGTAAGLGVYSRLAKSARALPVGVATTRSERIGNLARNIAEEFVAENAAMVVQDVIANPEDITLEAITANIASPLNLALATGVGGMRTRSANKRAVNNWLAENIPINNQAAPSIPLAKQLAATAAKPLGEIVQTIEDIFKSDTWLEAGFRRVANGGTIQILNTSLEAFEAVKKRFNPDVVRIEKPASEAIGRSVKLKKNPRLQFEHSFDADLFLAEGLDELSTRTGIDIPTLKRLRGQIEKAIDEAPVQKRAIEGNVLDRYKIIPDQSVPQNFGKKPFLYRATNGNTLVTPQPLLQRQVDFYKKTGYLEGESVYTVNGRAGTVKGVNANGKIKVEDVNGNLLSINGANLIKKADGVNGVWNPAVFTTNLAEQFIKVLNTTPKNKSFDFMAQEFLQTRRLPLDMADSFQQYVFNYVAQQADAGLEPALKTLFKSIRPRMVKESTDLFENAIFPKLNAQGYRIMPDGGSYALMDRKGNRFLKFETAEQLRDFVQSDIFDPSLPDLLPSKYDIPPGVTYTPVANNSRLLKLGKYASNVIKNNQITQRWLRSPMRLAEDIGELAGMPEAGVQFGRNMELFLNGINAAENGVFKPLVQASNRVIKATEKLTDEAKRQITMTLENRRLADLAKDLTPDGRVMAGMLSDVFVDAGGSDAVKKAYIAWQITGRYTDGTVFNMDKLKPEMRIALEQFEKVRADKANYLLDDKFLRYVDALERGVDIDTPDLIKSFNWDKATLDAYEEAKRFYDESKTIAQIENPITGYAPWITKWQGIPTVFNKIGGQGQFIHELQRIGITPSDFRVMEIDQLTHLYTKKLIYHKSPVAGFPGKTTGQLMDESLDILEEMKERGSALENKVSVEALEEWIMNIRGVPTPEMVNESAAKAMLKKAGHKMRIGNVLEQAFDFITLTKLSGRPILALRDVVSGVQLATVYGVDTIVDLFNFSDARKRQIDGLVATGELPQFDAEEIASRTAPTRLSEAVNKGLKFSGQPQTYRWLTANLYIHTRDKAIKAMNNAKGDPVKLAELLGPILDSGSQQSQQYFLNMAMRDPINAAKFLGARNAHNVANRFGRLNNPLGWQSNTFGRALGQFGSWPLNTISFLGSSIANSRSLKSAAWKTTKVAGMSYALHQLGEEAGLDLSNWYINPLSMIPTPGPLVDAYEATAGNFSMMFSPNERDRKAARSALMNAGSLATPTALQDMHYAMQVWDGIGSGYKTIMQGMGFDLTDEGLEGVRLRTIGRRIKDKIDSQVGY